MLYGVSCVPRKALEPTLLSLLPVSNCTEERRSQSQNADVQIVCTLLGINIFVSPHLRNDVLPIYSRLEFGSKSTSRNCLQRANVSPAILLTLLLTITFSMLVPSN